MSYYSNYEGHKPLYYESDSDDVPMISRERNAPPGCYHDNRSQPYRSGFWNEEPSVTQEIEQPKMSNLERLLKEAVEETERHSRELDEIFDWNSDPNHEELYDTFTNANEHLEDVEATEYNDYYSNDHTPYSSIFVFQDDSDDEMDKEEVDNEFTNYPHEISQVVLQELHELEPEFMEHADFKNSDFEDSNEEELEIEEILVEEVVEISVTPIFETVSVSLESNAVNEELENEVEVIKNKLEEAPIVLQNDNHIDVLENQVSQKLDYPNLDEELYVLLGLDNGELQELRNNGDGMMTEAELLESMEFKVDESHSLDKDCMQHEDDMLCTKGSLEVSLIDFATNALSFKCDFALVKEPKPPDPFIPGLQDLSLQKGVDRSKGDVNRSPWNKCERSKGLKFQVILKDYSLLDDPGDLKISSFLFLVVAFGECTMRNYTVMWLIDMSQGDYWMIGIIVWDEFYVDRKTKENFLPTEYDWKGSDIELTDPP